ncbi:MAG: trypsin-like peptidase domain-containing protein [Vicinamibacterales bacterium]
MKRFTVSLVLVLAGFVAGLVMTGRLGTSDASSAAGAGGSQASQSAQPDAAEAPASAEQSVAPPRGAPDFAEVAARAVSGVVNVSSLQVVRRSASPFANDPFFRYFFGDDIFPEQDRRSYSLGSGVLISNDGYVVTNSHVVGENVREITAVVADRQEVRGTLIGADPMTDIALLKLDVKGVKPVPWGDSSRLRVGQWVLAIGSPFQLNQTVTLGIISAVGRANLNIADYEDFIQTDAAINPGNSGGALVDASGQLIGINTAIYSESGGYQGIGFAVPSNLARRVIDDLLKYGEVRRGSIGAMQVAPLTPQLVEQLGTKDARGAVVWGLGQRAYDNGFRRWDVIVSVNGQPVDNPSQFLRFIADAPIGSIASIGILRNGKLMELKVRVASGTRGR